ncbi:prepilin peptidase [Rhodococcus sp. As11]|uniref:prepilin peptidase n=1 Tax=Rhodococcus sp. As11 TaxID=3029189 RepID=UPI003B7BC50E
MTGEATGVLATAVLGLGAGVIVRISAGLLARRRPPPGLCELACAGVALVVVAATAGATTIGVMVFGWWCVCLSTVDLLVRRLPNVLTLGGAGAILGVAAATGQGRAAFAGALLLAAPLLITHLTVPRSLGAGDVKLALGLGAVTGLAGPSAVLLGALLPPVLTAGAALFLRFRAAGRGGARVVPRALPHGPSMCAAAALASIVPG